jgi:hypothetical protein
METVLPSMPSYGTKHRFSGLSHARQCGDAVLRMLVTGYPPARGGGVASMAAKGWIERRADDHGRAVYCITEAGKDALRAPIPRPPDARR